LNLLLFLDFVDVFLSMGSSFLLIPSFCFSYDEMQTPQLSQLEEEDEASLHEELDEDDDNSQADSLDGSAISSLGSSTGRGGGNGSSGNIDSAANNADAPVNVASRDAAVVNPTSKDATISTNLALSAKRVSNISTNDLPSSTPAESHKSHTSSSSSPSRGLGRTLLWSSLLGAVILALAAQLVVVLAPLALSECSDLFAPLSDVAASTAAAEGDAGTREVANSRSSGMSGIAMTCSARVIRSLLTADRS
jgi:U3 small nucleolar RNA-associated protein 14